MVKLSFFSFIYLVAFVVIATTDFFAIGETTGDGTQLFLPAEDDKDRPQAVTAQPLHARDVT